MAAPPRPSALECASAFVDAALNAGEPSAGRVLHDLSIVLGTLVGPSGFEVLLVRALKLATQADPTLARIVATPDGLLEALPAEPVAARRASIIILAHMYELLIRLIGEDLARRVLGEAWPSGVFKPPPMETPS